MFLVKLLVSVGLLAFFLTRIELSDFLRAMATADFSLIAVALFAYLVAQLVSAMRWAVVVRPLGFRTRLKDLAVYYFIGMFFNLFAPSTVGGDVSRVYYLAREERRTEDTGWTATTMGALMSVFADRAIGMTVLLWLGAAALLLYPDYAVPAPVRYVTFILALGLVVALFLLPLLRRVLPESGRPVLGKLRFALHSYRTQWSVIPQAMLLSLVVHVIQTWMHVLLGEALQVTIPWSYGFILYPLVGTFAALPISLNGIGLREGGYLFLLGLIGTSSEKAIAFGLLWFLIIAVDSLVGGVLFVLKKSPRPSPVSTEIQI